MSRRQQKIEQLRKRGWTELRIATFMQTWDSPETLAEARNAGEIALDALTSMDGVHRCRTCSARIVKNEHEPCPECAASLQDAAGGN